MRFISPHKGYDLALRAEAISGYTPHGEPIISEKPLRASFVQGGLSPWELDLALSTFSFHGTYENEDVRSRCSWFDTEWAQRNFGWSDSDREYAETKMLALGNYGVDFILAEQPKAAKPWGSYDSLTDPERIVALMEETGTPAEDVLRYEFENKKRKEVIEAVEASSSAVTAEDAVVVSA